WWGCSGSPEPTAPAPGPRWASDRRGREPGAVDQQARQRLMPGEEAREVHHALRNPDRIDGDEPGENLELADLREPAAPRPQDAPERQGLSLHHDRRTGVVAGGDGEEDDEEGHRGPGLPGHALEGEEQDPG